LFLFWLSLTLVPFVPFSDRLSHAFFQVFVGGGL